MTKLELERGTDVLLLETGYDLLLEMGRVFYLLGLLSAALRIKSTLSTDLGIASTLSTDLKIVSSLEGG